MGLARQSMSCIDRKVAASSIVQRKMKAITTGRNRGIVPAMVLVWILSATSPVLLNAASFLKTEQLFYSGHYDECLEIALAEFDRGVWNDRWPQLAIKCLLTTGQYDQARTLYEQAKKRFATSIGIRSFGAEVLRFTGDEAIADAEAKQIYDMVQRAPWRYSASADLITLGRFFVDQGEDARDVLELFYDRVKKNNATYAPVHVAAAELALSKFDFEMAAQSLEIAAKLNPSNPQVFHLQALAFQESDRKRAIEALQQALELNPRYVPSLLLKADYEIDSEQYAEADATLAQVLEVNPMHPEAWAYHAVLAHLAGHYEGESVLREIALSRWSTNHRVDHLIGRKLSEKYRFQEGASYQRESLARNPQFIPAKFQLAQDLLRLGDEETGWQLAQQVFDRDAYNVVAYNLVTLHEELAKFTELRNERFILRMDAREARIYGARVVELLDEAHRVLCDKYAIELDGPVTVEIFPQQKDFAIRTFGLPGGAGFLGVCFGRVITANSPASQGSSPANWQSVLWHEFCHVVTLEKTRNRMPRWLSEGISVYEERQRDPGWGERLTPQYRAMILGQDLTPVSELSGAFLRPQSPIHLQFAYYEASIVVEFLIEKYGFETLVRILDDSGVGMPVNESLERYTGSLAEFELAFAAYAREKAEALAPEVDFEKVSPTAEDRHSATIESITEATGLFEAKNNNYWLIHQQADRLLREGRFEDACELLEALHQKFPLDRSQSSAAVKLARAYRELGENDQEREMLEHVSKIADAAVPVYLRLMDIHAEEKNWGNVVKQAERMLAVQPLQASPHEMLAEASQHLNLSDLAVDACSALLEMNPVDPAAAHFRLAAALDLAGEYTKSKRETLKALERAPRYQEALQLLLRLRDRESSIDDSD